MLALLRGLVKRRALQSKISRAIDARVGFYEAIFPLESRPERLLAWCREAVAQTSRPYGVDYLTLALAMEDPDGTRLTEVTFRALNPADFYAGGAARPKLESTLAAWIESVSGENGQDRRIRAILFSWGDLTSDLLRAS